LLDTLMSTMLIVVLSTGNDDAFELVFVIPQYIVPILLRNLLEWKPEIFSTMY
jgi:hypothetical protein